jgi:hypothetical protein
LNIVSGGAVTAASMSINSQSLLAIDVGNGSLLTVGGGSGAITNNGTVRMLAGAGAAASGQNVPISAGTWSSTGVYQPVGGTWNATSHVFTVSAVENVASGTPAIIDLLAKQRVSVDDNGPSGTGWSIGASFLAKTTSTPLTFTATAMNDASLAGLETLLAANQSILGGWDFSASGGYAAGDPAYLSFKIPTGYGRDDLQVWHHDAAGWTVYDATDLSCDGTYANFTVTGFSGYAITAVPEPGALAMLLAATVWLGLFGWRRRRHVV